MRPGLPSRAAVVGFFLLLVPLALSEPLGRAIGACDATYGCGNVLFLAGAPAGVLAGLVVRRWWDVLELGLAMWLGAALWGVVVTALDEGVDAGTAFASILVTVPLGAAILVGFLGLPLFAIVGLIRWAARRNAPSSEPPPDGITNSHGGSARG